MFVTKSVSTTTDEITFLRTFIDSITSVDSRIICLDKDTLEEQFANTSIKTTFTISVCKVDPTTISEQDLMDNIATQIIFTRDKINSANADAYAISIKINNTIYNTNFSMYHSGYVPPAYQTNRIWNYAVITNDKIVEIELGSSYLKFPASNVCVTGLFSNEYNGVAYSVYSSTTASSTYTDSMSAINSTLKCIDSNSSNNQCSAITRHNYYAPSGMVEFTKNKPLYSNNTIQLYFDGLYDCTTVTPRAVIGIEDKQYFALSYHTLMEI